MSDIAVPTHPFEEKWTLAQIRYKGTIRTFARNCVHQIPGMDLEDIEQELLVVLWKCVMNYNPDRGASFNTLFQGSARNKCISLIRTANTKGRKGVTASLTDEAVERMVDEVFEQQSTEDTVMLRMELQEYVSKHGVGCLLDAPKPGRKAKVVA